MKKEIHITFEFLQGEDVGGLRLLGKAGYFIEEFSKHAEIKENLPVVKIFKGNVVSRVDATYASELLSYVLRGSDRWEFCSNCDNWHNPEVEKVLTIKFFSKPRFFIDENAEKMHLEGRQEATS